MFVPDKQTIHIPSHSNDNPFRLEAVSIEVRSPSRAKFVATVVASPGIEAPVRCWVSNAVEGALDEADTTARNGEQVELSMELATESVPELACIRIESAPFATENVYGTSLCKGEIYFHGPLKLRLNSIESTNQMIRELSPEHRAEISPAWIEMVEESSESEGWIHGFTVLDRETGERVGHGGFKGRPDNGVVEIAYGIDEPYQRRGFGTELAQALTYYAFGNEAQKIIAHTKPGHEASEKILSSAEYECLGEVDHPEDGKVNRWELKRVSC